ncbi:MAG TPA: uracil-DNA glycosylase [Anaerolineae bacterium]
MPEINLVDSLDRDAWRALEAAITHCSLCPRLVAWREQVATVKRRAYRDDIYWGRGVPGFGDPHGRILIVGLAPAAHGANRTGRMFTGDSSGDFLYGSLYRAGFANLPISQRRDDGLVLTDVLISAVCRCAPPDNKPAPGEIATCLPYLAQEIALMENLQIIVALGRIAFDGLLNLYRAPDRSRPRLAFGHGLVQRLGEGRPWLITSYHPSRQNTQTGRLTPTMFDLVWAEARRLLSAGTDSWG